MAAADTTRLSVYGAPNDEVKVILNGFGAVYFGLIEGFTRSMSCPLWCARAAGSYALYRVELEALPYVQYGMGRETGLADRSLKWLNIRHRVGQPRGVNAISVNSMHRIRTAQDLAVYNLVLSEEIEGFDGAAHIETWNSDPAWQGVREVAEQLTGIDDWCEAIFAANVVFEPLVGGVPEPPRAARGTG
jgi:hypothetical protein